MSEQVRPAQRRPPPPQSAAVKDAEARTKLLPDMASNVLGV